MDDLFGEVKAPLSRMGAHEVITPTYDSLRYGITWAAGGGRWTDWDWGWGEMPTGGGPTLGRVGCDTPHVVSYDD